MTIPDCGCWKEQKGSRINGWFYLYPGKKSKDGYGPIKAIKWDENWVSCHWCGELAKETP